MNKWLNLEIDLNCLKIYYQYCMPGKNSGPGATIAIQTFGDFLGFNPHGHVLITDGCFPEKGLFKVVPAVRLKHLEKIFRSKVLTLLLSKGKITPDHINLLKSWKHSGFQVYCGPRIHPRKKEAMENLARYIIRASFSQSRLWRDISRKNPGSSTAPRTSAKKKLLMLWTG